MKSLEKDNKYGVHQIEFRHYSNIIFFVKHAPNLTIRKFFEPAIGCLNGKTADLYYDPQNQLLYKFFLAKKKKNGFIYFTIKWLWEIAKNILGIYTAKKEFIGNRLMCHHGFNVAEPLGLGFALSPFAYYRCLLIIKYIQNTSTLKALLESGLSSGRLEIIRKKIIYDIERMSTKKIRFRDFTVNNILVDDENNIFWIDTRADRYYFNILYQRAKNLMLSRFIGSFKQINNAPQWAIDDFIHPIRSLTKL